MNIKLKLGNCLEELDKIEKNSIDSIVTDPPYELNFMGKGWDNAGISFSKKTWQKCYEVLKPGGYMLAFGGTRTYHRIACAIEDAGFEIRDCVMWLYGSGFPKSMDISKQIDKRNGRKNDDFKKLGKYLSDKITDTDSNCANKIGFSSTLVRFWKLGERIPNKETWMKLKKLYHLTDEFDYIIEREEAEREIIGQKEKLESYQYKNNNVYQINGDKEKVMLDITKPATELAKQWEGWGTCLKPAYEPIIVARKPFKGSLVDNVIENSVGGINIDECRVGKEEIKTNGGDKFTNLYGKYNTVQESTHTGRFPANVIHDGSKEVCGGMPYTKSNGGKTTMSDFSKYNGSMMNTSNLKDKPNRIDSDYIAPNDSGSASRYFYCAKASKKDRDEGLDMFEENTVNDGRKKSIDNPFQRGETQRHNIHPTVKPTELMQYLIRLVTPKNGVILDPFMGSGSTGKATMYENLERQANYSFIGIELDEEYMDIARARIEYVKNKIYNKEDEQYKQTSLFEEEI